MTYLYCLKHTVNLYLSKSNVITFTGFNSVATMQRQTTMKDESTLKRGWQQCGTTARRTWIKRAVVPHPSASWMLTFTRFAAPRSSETEKRDKGWDSKNKLSLQKQSEYLKSIQKSVINVFSLLVHIIIIHSLQVELTATLLYFEKQQFYSLQQRSRRSDEVRKAKRKKLNLSCFWSI